MGFVLHVIKTCNGAGPSVCTTCESPKRLNNGYCYICHASCLTCSGPGAAACTSCVAGEFLSGGFCSQCDSSCAACSGTSSSDCTTCSDGEYLSSGSCYECDSSCLTCTAAGSSGCSSCSSGEYLKNGSCEECDSSCVTCSGAGPSGCTFCAAGEYLDNGVCNDCDSSCASCDGAGSLKCTSCGSGKYLNSGTCSGCDTSCSICYATGPSACISCPNGRYLDAGNCYECDSTCLTCDGGGDTECTSCAAGRYLDGSSCLECDGSCTTCTGGSSQECSSCPANYYSVGSSCYALCDSPLVKSSSGGVNYCETPCVGNYAYLEGGCGSCDSPRSKIKMNSFDVCKFPCTDTSTYFYWNGSCFNDCPSPLSQSTIGTQNSCEFPCGGDFVYWDGSCESQCQSPLISETQGTYEPRKFCWFPCQSNEYLFWNGSCLSTCPSPLSGLASKGQKFCNFSCSSASEYLYWNGSCESSCPMPLISEIQSTSEPRNFCWSPCQSDKYVYWNGSCLDDCLSPLSKVIEPNIKYCVNPCGDSSPNYLYSNQSCLSTCPSPLSAINNPGVQYCANPCRTGFYLYENKTCLSTCASPFLKRIEPGNIQYCDRPCSQPKIYWYKNASCLSECKFPYIEYNYSGVVECLPPCKDSEYFYVYEKECNSKCESPFKIQLIDVIKTCQSNIDISLTDTTKIQDTITTIASQGTVTSGGMKAASALNSNNPSSALLAGLSSMLQYIRYMKINYPAKVQMLFLVSAGNPISLGFDFDIPSSIGDRLGDYTLPEVFEKYDINSNFVYNLWDFLATLLLILLLILGLELVKCLFIRCAKVNLILTKLVEVVKWNFPLMMICSSSGDIFFYGSLQIRSSPLNNLASIICFIICIVMMGVVIFILSLAFQIVRNFNNHRRVQADHPQNNEINWVDRWRGYEILYDEYEEKSLWAFSYMTLFILRGLVFNLTLANLFDYPLLQCIIINLANLSMFGYLLYLRPLKNLLALVQLFINEGLVNVLGISILILAIMDKGGIHGQSTRYSVGQAILFVIKTFNTFGLAFLGIGVLIFLISIFKIYKKLRAKGIKSPIKMLQAVMLGEIESQKSPSNPLNGDALKKPKILKPPRKLSNTKDSNLSNEIIFIDPENNPSEMTLNFDKSSFALKTSQTKSNEELDLQVIKLNSSVSQGSNERKVSFEKSGSPVEKEREVSRLALSEGLGSNIDANSSLGIQSWRSIEERIQRINNVYDEMDRNLSWFAGLRKLKSRLKESSKRIEVEFEDKKNFEQENASLEK